MNKRKHNTVVLKHGGQRLGDSFKNRTVVTHAEINGQLLAICATGLTLCPFEARDITERVVFKGYLEIENKSIVTFRRGNVLGEAVVSFDVESWEQIFDVKAACAPKGSIYDNSVVAVSPTTAEKAAPETVSQSAPAVTPKADKVFEALQGYESRVQFDLIVAAREAVEKGNCSNIALRGLLQQEKRLQNIGICTPDRFTNQHRQDLRNTRKLIAQHWTRLMAREKVGVRFATTGKAAA